MYIQLTSNTGRGVFADKSYSPGERIEQCEIIVVPFLERKILDNTILYNYYFSRYNEDAAIALGKGSLYNHSYTPNAVYRKDFVNNIIIFEARKNISPHEEITVNYNGDPDSQVPLWFMVLEN